MKHTNRTLGFRALFSVLFAAVIGSLHAAETIPVLSIQADQVAAKSSPILYGLMTEEINYCYDGGLYAELIVNRNFKEDRQNPVWWHLVGDTNAVSMSLDTNQPLNAALNLSLKLEVKKASTAPLGIANEGYWGIPVKPDTRYRATVYAKAAAGFSGSLTVAIVGTSNATVYASAQIPRITQNWQKYEVTLNTGKGGVTKDARFAVTTTSPGTVWLGLVSLFPPTWKDRPNGLRRDIMQLLADMKPAFLRFPGGNYLEGNTIATRFDWKRTIGDISQRPGHMNDAWRYWSSDGLGLLEFLEWCEDLNMQPVVGIYAGYSLRGEQVAAGPDLEPYVQDGLDEIEYITGDASTKWGARRAQDGHPAPFKLTYVEIGNEENLGRAGGTYNARFTQFYDAIKAKYPSLKIISAAPSSTSILTTRTPDMMDDHYYPAPQAMIALAHRYDNYDRSRPKIFVGEWATRQGNTGPLTPNMEYTLSDAAFLTGLERNSDVVIIASYAPLFVNVNPGGSQWRTDLIGFDALTSFGSPSYYLQKMFNLNRGDTVLPVKGDAIPTREIPMPQRRGGAAGQQPTTQQLETLFFVATRDSATGTIYLKLVNTVGTPQPVRVEIKGVASVSAEGQSVVLAADSPQDTNSITEPTKIVPVTTTFTRKVDGFGTSFTHTFSKYSVTVLVIKAR